MVLLLWRHISDSIWLHIFSLRSAGVFVASNNCNDKLFSKTDLCRCQNLNLLNPASELFIEVNIIQPGPDLGSPSHVSIAVVRMFQVNIDIMT